MCCSAKESFAFVSKRPFFGGRVPWLTHLTRIFGSALFITPIARRGTAATLSFESSPPDGSATLARAGRDVRVDEVELLDVEVAVLVVDERVDDTGGATESGARLAGPVSVSFCLYDVSRGGDVLFGRRDSGLRSAMDRARRAASGRRAALTALGDDMNNFRSTLVIAFAISIPQIRYCEQNPA